MPGVYDYPTWTSLQATHTIDGIKNCNLSMEIETEKKNKKKRSIMCDDARENGKR